MTATVIDGKTTAADVLATVKAATDKLVARTGVTPGIAVIIVGEDPASQAYVRSKGRRAEECGFKSETHRLPADTPEADLLALIDRLNRDDSIHGILVQLPVPDHIDEGKVIQAVDPDKDVDGLSVINAGRLATGQQAMVSCTPLGCLMMLREERGELTGLDAVVIGRSNLVGKPMGQLLLRDSCTVTMTHSRTKDLAAVVRRADIVVAAVGVPHMVKGDWIKPGATVIDVGMNRLPPAEEGGKGKLVGDVDFAAAREVAGAITPVPGGVGPMTIACLLANTLTATARVNGLPEPEGLTA